MEHQHCIIKRMMSFADNIPLETQQANDSQMTAILSAGGEDIAHNRI